MKYETTPSRHSFFSCSGEAGGRLVRSLAGAAGLAVLASVVLSLIAAPPAQSAEATAGGEAGTLAAAALERLDGTGPDTPRSERATLRSAVSVSGDVVTLGDFFDNAGPLADRPIFRSPDIGTTGPVSAARVVDMARAAGLSSAETGGLVEVSVTRLARQVESSEIARLIAVEAMRRPGHADDTTVDDLEVVFDQPVEPRSADVRAVDPVRVVSLNVSPQTGRFDALVQIDQGEKSDRIHLRGALVETVSVTVLTRALARGELVSAEDLRIDRQPRNQAAGRHVVVVPDEIVGRQARRSLRAGQAVASADFARPQVIARGDLVTVIYRTRTLKVTTRGQAVGAGAVGDTIGVVNPQSKRTLQGTVAAAGLVEISAGATSLASLAKVDQ